MRYDLAVWQGETPDSDRGAAETHMRLYSEFIDSDESVPVADSIVEFVRRLTVHWSDVDPDDDTLWSSAPLLACASGPYIYFGFSWQSAATVAAFAASVATELGLNCFDPQNGAVLSGRS